MLSNNDDNMDLTSMRQSAIEGMMAGSLDESFASDLESQESADYNSDLSSNYTSDAEDRGHGPIRVRSRSGSGTSSVRRNGGRADGSHCKCKCCGTVGYYTKSCGRKHRCAIGKCGEGIAAHSKGGVDNEEDDKTLFEVQCARCHVDLNFELPTHPAYIACYSCNAKMLIQPIPRPQADSEYDATEEGSQASSFGDQDCFPEASDELGKLSFGTADALCVDVPLGV